MIRDSGWIEVLINNDTVNASLQTI
jgi:hypothetical protein